MYWYHNLHLNLTSKHWKYMYKILLKKKMQYAWELNLNYDLMI